MGLRLHNDILNLAVRRYKKTLFTPLIVVNLSSSSILQVEQQKVTAFFLLFNFIHTTFCRLYSWLILCVQKMIYFDLLCLSLPGSLGYIVCQHYESLFVLPIFDILFNMRARWFCLSWTWTWTWTLFLFKQGKSIR